MELKALEKVLASPAPPQVFLLTGTDEAQVRRAVQAIQRRFCGDADAQWGVSRVDASETPGEAIADQAATAPLLGDHRVVIVGGAEHLTQEEALIPLIEDPPPYTVLVLVAAEVDKRRKLFQSVKARGMVLEYDVPAGDQLKARLQAALKGAGVRLDPGAYDILAERLLGDVSRLDSELEKLVVYAGAGGTLSAEEVDRLISRGVPQLGQYAVFDFVDAVADGRGADALERLDALLSAGQVPLVTLTMIARQFRLLLGALAWRGENPAAAAEALGLKSTFPIRKAMAQVRRWSLDEIAAALEACAACDDGMKRGVDGRRALESLTVKLAWAKSR